MSIVWTALTVTDDLVMIRDLRSILDLKTLTDAINAF